MSRLEINRIEDQLKRAFEGEAWHGPSLSEVMNGVTHAQAAARPLPGAHSIWEIVLHITTWESVGRRRVAGEVVEVSSEEDWPAVREIGEREWRESLKALEAGHQELRRAISGLSDADLRKKVAGTEYSVYFLLHGVIQHDLYHAGQIAILRRSGSPG